MAILMDAGSDWKPRNKVVKKFTPKPKQASKTAKPQPAPTAATKQQPKQQPRPSSAKPKPTSPKQSVTRQSSAPGKPVVYTMQPAPKAYSAQQEQQEILSILMDAGKDWKPRNRVVKKVTPKQRRGKAYKPVEQPTQAIGRRVTPSSTQVEQQEILSVLMDAGSDWQPRNRVVRQVAYKRKTKPAKPVKFVRGVLARPALGVTPRRGTPAWNAMMAARAEEQNEILSVLMDAGKDCKPRTIVHQNVKKYIPKPRQSKKKAAPQKNVARRKSLTDAQKKQKREIMEILLHDDSTPKQPAVE
ncbi:hypothetical protein DAPPUDRAFT_279978, partial [Daphnia pulex]